MRKATVVLILCVACLWAEVPNEITYQGRLREYGQPVSGTRTMRFDIYDDASSGIQRWTSGDVSVIVSSGAFAHKLTPTGVDWRGKDYWIETIISGKVLAPREKITAQAFAIHSQTAESVTRSSGDIKFEVGATSYVVVNSGGLRLNSGSITFPDNTAMTTANVGAAGSVSSNGDALIIGDADSSGAGDVKVRIGTTERLAVTNAGEVKSLLNGSTYYMVPHGGIIMWSGTISDIPPGWGLCDGKWYNPGDLGTGQTGQASSDPSHYVQTPNLVDRFILSVSNSSENPGATGGANSKTISADQLPAHNHYAISGGQSANHRHFGNTDDTTVTHNHAIYAGGVGSYAGAAGGGSDHEISTQDKSTTHQHSFATGGAKNIFSADDQDHTHAITVNDTGQIRGNAIDFKPAYYKLAFIMKL